MKHLVAPVQARRSLAALVAIAIAAVSSGCGSRGKAPSVITSKMGERVSVGSVVYNVLEANWRNALGGSSAPRVPQHRFVTIRMTITNGGAEDRGIPLLSLYDADGKAYRELEDGENVDNWLGLFRLLKPVESVNGTILFDVPPGNYKLQVTDGSEPGMEIIAYVEIPLQLESDPVLSEPPSIQKQ